MWSSPTSCPALRLGLGLRLTMLAVYQTLSFPLVITIVIIIIIIIIIIIAIIIAKIIIPLIKAMIFSWRSFGP